MAMNMSDLEREARSLPVSDRVQLAQSLLTSVDPGEDVDAEDIWLVEAERRYQAYRQGRITARPSTEVFRDIHAQLT